MNEPSFPPSPRKAEKWDVKPLPTVPLLSQQAGGSPGRLRVPTRGYSMGPGLELRVPQDGCISCLWRTRLTTGWPRVSSPALARTSTVTLSLLLSLWPQCPHPRRGTDYLPLGSEGLKENRTLTWDPGWCRSHRSGSLCPPLILGQTRARKTSEDPGSCGKGQCCVRLPPCPVITAHGMGTVLTPTL